MKFFLDTADITEIKRINQLGLVDGVTTNPSIIAKEGRDFETVIKEIAQLIPGPISAEVISLETKGMLEEARKIAKWAPNVVVKIPMTEAGLAAVHQLSQEGIPTNVTLIFTLVQGIMAAKAGATYISPFLGRLDDIGSDSLQLVHDLRQVLATYAYPTEIISASIRSLKHVEEVMKVGSQIATIPGALFPKLWHHPLTDSGIQGFLTDWQAFAKK